MTDKKKCSATTKSGDPCRGNALPGSEFCFAHQPKDKVKPEPEEELCGHINRHSYGPDGKLDNLKCTLPKGHPGNHRALHEEYRSYNAMVETTPKPDNWREWTDDAGIPADQIKPRPRDQVTGKPEEPATWEMK